jgi:hypothetical protein
MLRQPSCFALKPFFGQVNGWSKDASSVQSNKEKQETSQQDKISQLGCYHHGAARL